MRDEIFVEAETEVLATRWISSSDTASLLNGATRLKLAAFRVCP